MVNYDDQNYDNDFYCDYDMVLQVKRDVDVHDDDYCDDHDHDHDDDVIGESQRRGGCSSRARNQL